MFSFFRKREEPTAEETARAAAHRKVLEAFEKGEGSLLDAALVAHLQSPDNASFARFVIAFDGPEIFTLSKGGEEIGDSAMTIGPDDIPYIAVFSTRERAAAALEEGWGPFQKVIPISPLTLVFSANGAGIILNVSDEHLNWSFTPEQTTFLKNLYEKRHLLAEGDLYRIRSKGVYRVLKVLKTDDGGVHIRHYGNAWQQPPQEIDPAQLTLEPADENSRSIGHMPLKRGTFLAMGPIKVGHAPVMEEELDGYSHWLEAKGGYFGS